MQAQLISYACTLYTYAVWPFIYKTIFKPIRQRFDLHVCIYLFVFPNQTCLHAALKDTHSKSTDQELFVA